MTPCRTGSGCWPPPGSSSLSKASRSLSTTSLDTRGVGVGTAYRRFANKGELLDALFAEQTVELAAAADAGLADPDPWHGLVSYLERSLALQLRDKGWRRSSAATGSASSSTTGTARSWPPRTVPSSPAPARPACCETTSTGTDLTFIQVGLNAIMTRSRRRASRPVPPLPVPDAGRPPRGTRQPDTAACRRLDQRPNPRRHGPHHEPEGCEGMTARAPITTTEAPLWPQDVRRADSRDRKPTVLRDARSGRPMNGCRSTSPSPGSSAASTQVELAT